MKKIVISFALMFPLLAASQATSLQTSRQGTQGRSHIYGSALKRIDPLVGYAPHQNHRWGFSIGYTIQDLEFEQWDHRWKFESPLLNDLAFLLTRFNDGYTSYFSGGFLEWSVGNNLISTSHFVMGAGFSMYDLAVQYYPHTKDGQKIHDHAQLPSGYALCLGWQVFADALISPKITLHADFMRGYSVYNGKHESLKSRGMPVNPYDSWKATAMLIHQSGFLVICKYEKLINRTDIPIDPSRFTVGIGYRFGMYEYNGEAWKTDPRR